MKFPMPHPLPLNPTQGPVAPKLLSNQFNSIQLYRIVQKKARKSTVGAEIEPHCNQCIARRETRRNVQHFPAKFVGRWLLQVSIRHKYPLGKIDIPMTDFMQDSWNNQNAGHNSAKLLACHFIVLFDSSTSLFSLTGITDILFLSDRYLPKLCYDRWKHLDVMSREVLNQS